MIFDSPCFIALLALVVGLERLPLNPRQAGNLTNIKAAPQVTRDRVSQIHTSTGRQGSRRMRATRPISTGRLHTSGSMSRTRTLPMTPWSKTNCVAFKQHFLAPMFPKNGNRDVSFARHGKWSDGMRDAPCRMPIAIRRIPFAVSASAVIVFACGAVCCCCAGLAYYLPMLSSQVRMRVNWPTAIQPSWSQLSMAHRPQPRTDYRSTSTSTCDFGLTFDMTLPHVTGYP